MFQHVDAYAGDPILSLNEAFQKDPRADKINLSIGIYFDDDGRIPMLPSVRAAELAVADAASQDIRGAVLALQARGCPKVGVTGYCMGGALTLLSTCFSPEIAAAVTWYGFPPLEYIDATKIRAAVMGHFATQDAFFSITQVPALEAKLKAAGVPTTVRTYEAMHAFANETQVDPHRVPTNRYDAEAAALALERTLAFLKQQLG